MNLGWPEVYKNIIWTKHKSEHSLVFIYMLDIWASLQWNLYICEHFIVIKQEKKPKDNFFFEF